MENITFIWDLDGTLLDSYPAILAGLEETYQHFGLSFDAKKVEDYILAKSVHDLLKEVAEKEGLSLAEMSAFRANSLREKNAKVQLMVGAREVLEWTRLKGIENFIYTHKGNNAHLLLQQFEIDHYFKEVVTGEDGFKRKPDPEALVYLIEKYNLNPVNTTYIGDRLLDAETALAAGIRSLNLKIDGVAGNEKITCLQDIPFLFEQK
ncbi:HAD-IA family hydrolase [Streptococcus cameli]